MSRYIGDPDVTDHLLCHRPDASPGPAPHMGTTDKITHHLLTPVPFRLVQVPPPPRNILTIRALVKLLGGGGGCKGPASALHCTGPIGQPFTSRPGGSGLHLRDESTLTMDLGSPVSNVLLQYQTMMLAIRVGRKICSTNIFLVYKQTKNKFFA
jgi:hypothetical protein